MPSFPDWTAHIVPFINFSVLIYFLVVSRNWHGPIQAAELERLRHDLNNVMANVASLQREQQHDRRVASDLNEQMLAEIRGLGFAISSTAEVKAKFDVIEMRTIEIEQQIAALACSERDWHAKHNSCPPDVKAKFTNGSS